MDVSNFQNFCFEISKFLRKCDFYFNCITFFVKIFEKKKSSTRSRDIRKMYLRANVQYDVLMFDKVIGLIGGSRTGFWRACLGVFDKNYCQSEEGEVKMVTMCLFRRDASFDMQQHLFQSCCHFFIIILTLT